MSAHPPIPGPRGLPLLGMWVPWRRDWLAEAVRMHRTHGDLVQLRMGPRRVFLVADPALIARVLGQGRTVMKEYALRTTADLFLGDGLLTSQGETHRTGRRLAQFALQPAKFHKYDDITRDCLERTQADWAHGASLDLHAATSCLAMRLATECLLGVSVEAHLPELRAAIAELDEFAQCAVANPAWLALVRLPLPRSRRFHRARAWLDALLEDALAAAPGTPGWLGHLAAEGTASGLSPAQVRDLAKSILLAGYETTASALTWTIDLIARHPGCEERLLAEFAATPAGADLPYTRQVLQESMRLFPPVWMIGREAVEPIDLGRLQLVPGDTVHMSPYVVQRDARHFPDPGRFDPDRFAPGREWPSDAYFPFGAGPRVCLGERFAMRQLASTLRAWLPRWRFVPDHADPVPFDAFITLKPRDGLRMKILRREAENSKQPGSKGPG